MFIICVTGVPVVILAEWRAGQAVSDKERFLENGFFRCMAIYCLICLGSLHSVHAYAETFFDDDTRTRFEGSGSLPPLRVDPAESAPSVTIEQFVFSDFQQAEADTVSFDEVEQLVERHRQARNGRYTLADLNDLVATLTNYYRERGFVLAQVIVPEQQIDENALTLQMVVGVLEAVDTVSNSHYGEDVLETLFRPQLGSGVQQDRLEQALYRLSDYPGVDIRSSLTAGGAPGTTRLNLTVLNEDVFSARFEGDNYGGEETGQYRLTLAGQYNNPTNRADQLSGLLRFSLFPANSVVGQVQYQLPLDAQGWGGPAWLWDQTDLSLGGSGSGFQVAGDLEILDIEGASREYFMRTGRVVSRDAQHKASVYQRFAIKRAESDRNDNSLGEDRLTVLEAGGIWEGTDSFLGRGSSRVQASVRQGVGDFLGSMAASNAPDSSRVGRSGDRAGGSFTVIALAAERLQAVGDQFVSARLRTQWSADLLTSLEAFSFGGQDSVRGYPSGDRRGDSGLSGRLEYFGLSATPELTLPISQLKLAVFWDAALGQVNDALPNETARPTAMSAGVYTEFMLAGDYQARMDLAIPFGAEAPSDGRSFSIGLRLGRSF